MHKKEEAIEELFERGIIDNIIPSKEKFKELLLSEKPFHIYMGIDPTAEKIHLGHIQNILFLEDLRKLGVKVTLLFGTFTARIGDPSEKSSARVPMTKSQIDKNIKSWKKQISPVLKLSLMSGAKLNYNNKWFDSFSLTDFIQILNDTTVQQLLERDMFQKRLKGGNPLYTQEILYPILQGYDSVEMKVDAELCGTDQTFNALMGRTMSKRILNKEKFVVVMKLIEADGVMMSKSTGTGVFVDIEKGGENRMFGSIMALPDSFIIPLFLGCTRVPMNKIKEMDVSGGVSTRDSKLSLAKEIVSMFWGKSKAEKAKEGYIKQFSEKSVPDEIETIEIKDGEKLLDIVSKHAANSNADAKRKFMQGAVSIDKNKIEDSSMVLKKDGEKILRVGRKIFKLR